MYQGTHRDLNDKLKPRSGFIYDVVMRGLDSSFWKAISGTVTVSSNKLRFNADVAGSYTQFKFGKFEFAVNVPTTPSSGEAKKWGLLNPSNVAAGSAYFEIAGAVFKAVSYDNDGNAESTTITWDSWEGEETSFEIQWEKDYVIFLVAGTVVATHKTRVGTLAQGLYISNSDSDNTDVGFVKVKDTSMYV